MRSTNSIEKTQIFATGNLLGQGKNIDIDLKKIIVNVMRDITIAENAVTAGKVFNSQLYTNNILAEK